MRSGIASPLKRLMLSSAAPHCYATLLMGVTIFMVKQLFLILLESGLILFFPSALYSSASQLHYKSLIKFFGPILVENVILRMAVPHELLLSSYRSAPRCG